MIARLARVISLTLALTLAQGVAFFTPPPMFNVTAAGCPTSSTFLARTSGLSATQIAAYQTMICGMVTDGTWSGLDALYMFATNSTATALLNLVSTSSPLTATGSPTFTANAGYTGNGSSSFLASSTALNGYSQFTQNSGTIGACDLSTRTTSASTVLFGGQPAGGSGQSVDFPLISGNIQYYINTSGAKTYGVSSTQGSEIFSRTSSSLTTLYRAGSSVSTSTQASQAPPAVALYLLGDNINGSLSYPSSDQIAYAFIGSGMNSTQASAMYSRLHAFLSAVGAPSGC